MSKEQKNTGNEVEFKEVIKHLKIPDYGKITGRTDQALLTTFVYGLADMMVKAYNLPGHPEDTHDVQNARSHFQDFLEKRGYPKEGDGTPETPAAGEMVAKGEENIRRAIHAVAFAALEEHIPKSQDTGGQQHSDLFSNFFGRR